MKKVLKSVCCIFFFCCLFVPFMTVADNTDFETWKADFEVFALKNGISPQTLQVNLPKMTLLPYVIETDMKKPEYLRNFWDYAQSRLTPEKLQAVYKMKRTYPTWLNRVSQEYGVPKEYILAIWSMETNLGSFMGKTSLLNSLGSLAYHPRRSNYFTKELLAYFKILESEPYPPHYGSWDGGFGNFQFMPTTFLAYAVDADENGTKSLTGSIPDSFASAANYLKHMGWRENELWGREVLLPQNFDWELMEGTKSVEEWLNMGVQMRYLPAVTDIEKTILARIHAPVGIDGPIFLLYPNFKYLKRWNGLDLYGITAGLLADLISGRRPNFTRSDEFKALKTIDFQQLQLVLANEGYYNGAVDGILGENMRRAIRMFQKDNQMIPDGYPNLEILTKLNIYKKE